MKIITIGFCLLGLAACTTTPDLKQSLTPYLDQFIGKNGEDVKQNIDLKGLNYQSTNKPISESSQNITYRVLRPIRIPIPTPTVIGSGSSGGFGGISPTTTIHHSSSSSYDVNFNCDITFHLNNNIVTGWTYKGRAC